MFSRSLNGIILGVLFFSSIAFLPNTTTAAANCSCSCAYMDANGNALTKPATQPFSPTDWIEAQSYCQKECASIVKPEEKIIDTAPNCTPPPIQCKCPGGKAAQAFDQKGCSAACTATAVASTAGQGWLIPNPDIRIAIGNVIKAMLGIVGSISFAMIIYGGFLYLTSAGAPETITKAKNIVVWAALGLMMIFAAYAIVSTLFQISAEAVGANLLGAPNP